VTAALLTQEASPDDVSTGLLGWAATTAAAVAVLSLLSDSLGNRGETNITVLKVYTPRVR